MKFTVALLLLGILAVGGFGFLGMNSAMDHDGGCIASLVNVATCPLQGIMSAMYHLETYASFSQAVLTSPLILLAFALLVLLVFAGLHAYIPIPIPARVTLRVHRETSALQRRKLIDWLSLFENSPSVIRGA